MRVTITTSVNTFVYTNPQINIEFYDTDTPTYIDIECLYNSGSPSTFIIHPMVASLYGWNYDLGEGTDINTAPDVDAPHANLSPYINSTKYTDATYHNAMQMVSTDLRGLPYIDSDIFFYAGHANYDRFALPGLFNVLWANTGTFYGQILPSLTVTKLAICAGCCTAETPSSRYNIANQFVINGAKSSIGWKYSIGNVYARTFTDKLFDEMCSNQYSISTAAAIAKSSF